MATFAHSNELLDALRTSGMTAAIETIRAAEDAMGEAAATVPLIDADDGWGGLRDETTPEYAAWIAARAAYWAAQDAAHQALVSRGGYVPTVGDYDGV